MSGFCTSVSWPPWLTSAWSTILAMLRPFEPPAQSGLSCPLPPVPLSSSVKFGARPGFCTAERHQIDVRPVRVVQRRQVEDELVAGAVGADVVGLEGGQIELEDRTADSANSTVPENLSLGATMLVLPPCAIQRISCPVTGIHADVEPVGRVVLLRARQTAQHGHARQHGTGVRIEHDPVDLPRIRVEAAVDADRDPPVRRRDVERRRCRHRPWS